MFSRILVPLDGSPLAECVLPHLIIMARMTKAKVTLLHVVEPHNAPGQVRPIDPLNWRFRRVEADRYLEDVISRLQAAAPTLSIEKVLLEGQAAERTIDFAHENKNDLIILSSHGRSGLSGWNVSGVVQKIILRARTSVLIVRAYQPNQPDLNNLHYRHILAPLDGSQRAECTLPVLATLSQEPHAEVLLAHVVVRPEIPRRVPLTAKEQELIDQLVTLNQEEMTKYLAQLKSRLSGDVHTRLIVNDSVIITLQELIEHEGVDLVVLSAHGYSGQRKQPYGSVGIRFIAYGTTPLLIVQDLPQQEIEPTQAELAAHETGNSNGGRSLIYDKPAT